MTSSSSIPVAANGIILFFLWLRSIPLCIYTTSSWSTHLSMDIYVVSTSWLLLQWFFFFNELKCLFIILFSFLNRLIYFNWRIITLQHCDGFSHTSIWIGHRHTHIPSILSSASQVPPQPIPPGCHRAVALGALRHTSNLHWLSILHMVTYVLEKAMAPHSSTLAWKIPWMEEPGRL